MTLIFKTKRLDRLFKNIYIFIFVFLVGFPFLILLEKDGMVPFLVLETLFLLLIFLIFLSVKKLKILIVENYLIVKIIFIVYKTNIHKIYKIRKGETMWSGFNKFGTTQNGLIVFTKHRNDLYITPENEELFLNEILKINPNIIIENIKK